MTTTLRESTGVILRRVFSATGGSLDGLINRKELKAHVLIALSAALVMGGTTFLSALRITLPGDIKDSLLSGLASAFLAYLAVQVKTINSGAKPVEVPPGSPAPATGAVAPADAPSTGEWTGPSPVMPYQAQPTARVSTPYTDGRGIVWPSREAYLRHYDA